jgi:hypothetical protein
MGIDDCLAAYDAVRHGQNNGTKSQTLSDVLAECARWLKTKKDKNAGTVNVRRAAILQLANDAFTEASTFSR